MLLQFACKFEKKYDQPYQNTGQRESNSPRQAEHSSKIKSNAIPISALGILT